MHYSCSATMGRLYWTVPPTLGNKKYISGLIPFKLGISNIPFLMLPYVAYGYTNEDVEFYT